MTGGDDEEPLPVREEMLADAGDRGVHGVPDAATVEFEHGMSVLPRVALVLVVALVAVFGWEVVAGVLAGPEAIVAAGALVRERVLAGEWWRLGSATFLHAGFDHLFGNCVMLYILGMALEHAVGVVRTLAVYAAAAVSGSLASVAASPGPSLGASGAVFGLAGAVTAILWRHRRRFHLSDRRLPAVLGVWAAWTIATGLLSPFIDNAAHAGGLAAGLACGLALAPRLLALDPAA